MNVALKTIGAVALTMLSAAAARYAEHLVDEALRPRPSSK